MERFVFARVEAKPGSVDILRDAAVALVEPCRAEEGNLAYNVFQGADNPREIWFHAHWRDQRCLDNHGSTEHVAAWLNIVKEYAVAPVDVHVAVKQA
ncbi:putative quinol monooxygenase [Micromonospora sp. NPDC005197]|uniref:putative quinol monooxygenase n=1 Tax=unclassified Micromonospora TaxID=2617518 RepID=UPI0033ACDA08